MRIFLAGLTSSHLRTESKYTQAASHHGHVLVSFFDYCGLAGHGERSNDIKPTKDQHERKLDLPRDPLEDC
jgi:hypothetical protein